MKISPYPEDGEDLVMVYGDHLNCTAIGNPDPVFEWRCSDGSWPEGEWFENENKHTNC